MQARYILDFGDVTHGKFVISIYVLLMILTLHNVDSTFNTFIMCTGDPLYEFLAMHVSVFKLDPSLLKIALVAYGLPLTIPNVTSNYTRPSYRAM